AAAIQLQNLGAACGFEVAVLVENVVGGQKYLMKYRADGAVFQQHGTVEQRATHVRGIGVANPTSSGGASFSSTAMRVSVWQLRCTNPEFMRRSRGRYPISASSGVTTRSAP